MSRFAVLTVALFALLAAPARGGGGPVVGADAGPSGVTARGVAARYVTQRVRGGTLVLRIVRPGGAVETSRVLREKLVVPAVAYDGSATGLSADGTTLVLAAPSGTYAKRSRFAVLDTGTLAPRQTVSLRGDYALDAISPDGETLFLIETLSRDGTRYDVRAYDLRRRRMLRDPIVDPGEADEPMRGSPVSRVMSRDGRWAYTLYDGNGKTPFIHALDTERARARCVDLDALAGRDDVVGMVLGLGGGGGGSVVVRDYAGRRVLSVDPRTFAVHPPRAAAPAVVSDGGPGWLWPFAGVAALALLAAVALKLGGVVRPANFRL
jgi:hypothetical protein